MDFIESLNRIETLETPTIVKMSVDVIARLTNNFDEQLTRILITRGKTNYQQRKLIATVKDAFKSWKKGTDVLWGAMPQLETYPDYFEKWQLDIECGWILTFDGCEPDPLESLVAPTSIELALDNNKQSKMKRTDEVKTDNKRLEVAQQRIAELEQEVNKVKSENAELREQLQQSAEKVNEEETADWAKEKEDTLVELLTPIFNNNCETARSFIEEVNGQSDIEIIEILSRYVNQNKASKTSVRRKLWSVLHAFKIYKAGETNWNLTLNNRI